MRGGAWGAAASRHRAGVGEDRSEDGMRGPPANQKLPRLNFKSIQVAQVRSVGRVKANPLQKSAWQGTLQSV